MILKYFGNIVIVCAVAAAASMPVYARTKYEPPQTAEFVDPVKFMGLWYEIARYPLFFESGVGVTSEFSLLSDGRVRIIFSHMKNLSSRKKSHKGMIWITDKETNAKFKAMFLWPFKDEFWVLVLDKEYKYTVVGCSKRKALWVMSRTPQMDDELYNSLLKIIAELKFDPNRLRKTPQTRQLSIISPEEYSRE